MSGGSDRPTPVARAIVAVLFAVVTIGALWVPLYNRLEPSIFGVPFFYWFQIVWIVAAASATALAYRLKM